MKASRFALATAFLCLNLCGLSLVCTQPKTVTILHTNDMHAAFLPHPAGWVRSDPKPMVGGFQELWWAVDSLRKAVGTSILMDAGDVMTGTPIAEYEDKGVYGGALFEMMNDIGYEVWTIGNHDLDISQDNLRGLTKIARFPTLSANLTDSLGNFVLNNKDFIILEKGGVKIGIIGIMSRELFRLTNTNNLGGLMVSSPVQTAQRLIDKVDPLTDLIVALTHEGVDEDSILAASTNGLDVIIGWHSHTRLTSPKVVNGVLICQTGSNCENLGVLTLTVEDDKVTKYDGKLLQLWAREDRPPNKMSEVIKDIRSKIDREYGEVLGSLPADLRRSRQGESAIGDFVADAIREGSAAQVGVTNTSGIRKDLLAGPITKLDLFELSPFRNFLTTFKLTGRELREFARRYAQSLIDGRSSIQLSGLKCTWKNSGGEAVLQSLSVGGVEPDDTLRYTCATSDFVVNQGDKYLGIIPDTFQISNATVFRSLLDKVRKEKTISAKIENRFEEIK